MDSLRYWVEAMHVDGFRFDLTSALARDPFDFDYGSGFLDAVRQDPVLSQGEADRRALGPGRRRLPGRRLPARLVGVERQVPRHGAALLEGRGEPDPGAGGAADRLGRHAGLAGPAPDGLGQLHHRARRLHACTIWSATTTSTTRPTARTIATASTRTTAGTAASRARPTIRRCSSCARSSNATCWRRSCCRRACRCCWPATSSATRSTATTTPTARTARSPGSSGTRSIPACWTSSRC